MSMTAQQLRKLRIGGNVQQKISFFLVAMLHYWRAVFPVQPDLTLILALNEERLLRLTLSVLFPTEEEATQLHKGRGSPSILEQEWAAWVIAEYSCYATKPKSLRRQMKAEETDDSKRGCVHYTPRGVISLFYPEILSDSPYVASTCKFSGEAKGLLLRNLLK